MKTGTLLFLALVAASDGSDTFATISTLSGETYTNAAITELTPKGVVLHSDSGVAMVPYAKLPKALQTRYGYNAAALAEVLADGIDGTYSYQGEGLAFAGEVISFKGNEFTYQTFTDVGPSPGPVRGKFRIDGNWLFLQHKNVYGGPARILAVIGGRLAIFLPSEYKYWRDSGKAEPYHEPLYRRPQPK